MASRHDVADAEISIALQLSSSSTLTLDSFTASLLYTQLPLDMPSIEVAPTTSVTFYYPTVPAKALRLQAVRPRSSVRPDRSCYHDIS